MTVQEFAVHILLAGSIRIGRMTLRLERNVIPLHQEPIMGRDIRFERMIAVCPLPRRNCCMHLSKIRYQINRCFPTKLIPT